MTKIIINVCFGGFGLSTAAFEWLIEHKKWTVTKINEKRNWMDETAQIGKFESGYFKGTYAFVKGNYDFRSNSDLIECIETLGDLANGMCAKLKVVEIPNDIEWEINEYDGNEDIHEVHRSWW